MLLYAITDGIRLAAQPGERARLLARLAADWASGGVDFIQIREKDLEGDEFISLSQAVVQAARLVGPATQILVGARPEIAIEAATACGADGIHLAGGLSSSQLSEAIRKLRREVSKNAPVSVSCHSVEEVAAARSAGATLALFGPIFEKTLPAAAALPGVGLEMLSAACLAASQGSAHARLPVLALGGITARNATQCIEAGAAGVASIRLFLRSGRRCGLI